MTYWIHNIFLNYKKHWAQFSFLNWAYIWTIFSKYFQELKVQVKYEVLILAKSHKTWHTCSDISNVANN